MWKLCFCRDDSLALTFSITDYSSYLKSVIYSPYMIIITAVNHFYNCYIRFLRYGPNVEICMVTLHLISASIFWHYWFLFYQKDFYQKCLWVLGSLLRARYYLKSHYQSKHGSKVMASYHFRVYIIHIFSMSKRCSS